jgi:hypothetical protein
MRAFAALPNRFALIYHIYSHVKLSFISPGRPVLLPACLHAFVLSLASCLFLIFPSFVPIWNLTILACCRFLVLEEPVRRYPSLDI